MSEKREKKKSKDSTAKTTERYRFSENLRFVVPMPGKSSWNNAASYFPMNAINRFSNQFPDLKLTDYQERLLMEREYPID